jgi:hypothetical protein
MHSKIEKITKVNLFENVEPAIEYDFVELAPELFSTIRKMHNIDDKLIKGLFSKENIANIEVHVSARNGGSFYLAPA